MRKTEFVTINGMYFELQKPIERSSYNNFYSGAVYDEIDHVYGRPSQTKREIWHDWCEWCFSFTDENKCTLDISSHTCMTFSITGTCIWNGKRYDLWITKDHNRAYPVE